jgi:hypothetical protein
LTDATAIDRVRGILANSRRRVVGTWWKA